MSFLDGVLKGCSDMDVLHSTLDELIVEGHNSDSIQIIASAMHDERAKNINDIFTTAASFTMSIPLDCDSNNSLPRPMSPLLLQVENISDLLACTDHDFERIMNISRRTIKNIFDASKLLGADIQYTNLLMFLYYLTSNKNSLSDIAQFFELDNEQSVLTKLSNISTVLLTFKRNSKLNFPMSSFEEDIIIDGFKVKSNFSNVLGALGAFKLMCKDNTEMTIVAVCDHEYFFRFVSISNEECTVEDAIRKSPIFERLSQEHQKGYTFFCPPDGYPSLPQLFPGLQSDELSLSPHMSTFSTRHNNVVNYIKHAVTRLVSRFPRLYHLNTVDNNLVTCAFILENIIWEDPCNRSGRHQLNQSK